MARLSEYLKSIESALSAGNATEHTYRPAFKSLVESLNDSIVATNEPKRVKCGAPDFIATLSETMRLMCGIDDSINQHGGFPLT